ncbi:UNVERIFIED_CONTAM: hypothetical protein Sradi_5590100 [Sesamum radiatum]|uniref:Uncharacterized protein n=1 Tax=Sesamum radiatum TaxID=300843 RepID=A0AAW2KZG0_SESRA
MLVPTQAPHPLTTTEIAVNTTRLCSRFPKFPPFAAELTDAITSADDLRVLQQKKASETVVWSSALASDLGGF